MLEIKIHGARTEMTIKQGNILCVANLPSDVGYAWWLMESFWIEIAVLAQSSGLETYLCYPKVNAVSKSIQVSPIYVDEFDIRLANYSELKAYLRSRDIRIIYFSDSGAYSALYFKLKLAGVKKIVNHDHTPGVRPPVRGFKSRIKYFINSLPWISADLDLATTEFVKQRMLENGCIPETKVKVVKNGLPIKTLPISVDLKAMLNMPGDSIVAVSVGRANKYKGIDMLIDAASTLGNEFGSRLHIVHIGDGPDLADFQAQVLKRGLADNFHFLGKRKDVLALVQSADFGIHPSKGEVGYSLAILEYMYCGLPVIVPDNPSVCEATDHEVDGLIYQERSIESLCSAISYACNNLDKVREMGIRAHKKVVEQYDIAGTHKALGSIFAELIAESEPEP